MSLIELMTAPEQDGWIYSDGPSVVCSTFIMTLFKKAKMFGTLKINAAEFGPKDLYELSIFNKDFQRPSVCREADPHLPYCQLTGKNRI